MSINSNKFSEQFMNLDILALRDLVLEEVSLVKIINLLPKYDVKTIGDLANLNIREFESMPGVGQTKVNDVLRLQLILEKISSEEVQRIIENQKRKEVQILPRENYEGAIESGGNLIWRFLNEFVALSNELKVDISTANVVELMYIHNLTIEQASVNLDLSKERVRQLASSKQDTHKSFVWQVRSIVSGRIDQGVKVNFTLSEKLKKVLRDIELFCQGCPSIESLENRLGCKKNALIAFICDFVGATILDGDKGRQTRLKGRYVVKIHSTKINDVWGYIFDKLSDSIKPYLKEQLLIDIKKEFKGIDRNEIETICNIIENSSQFVVEKQGITTKYQLSWKDLPSALTKIERIVYDAQGSIRRTDIIAEYNRRAVADGEKKFNNDRGISASRDSCVDSNKTISNICELAEGGLWIWRENAETIQTHTLQGLVEKYMVKNKIATVDGVFSYLKEYIPDVKDRSVKTTLNEFCYSTTSGEYIHKNYVGEYPEYVLSTRKDIVLDLVKLIGKGEYTYQELYEKFSEEYYTIPLSKIRKACEMNPEIFISKVSRQGKGCPKLISINVEWGGNYNERKVLRDEKEYKKMIRRSAINILRDRENVEMLKIDLVNQLKKYLPSNIKQNNIYKIFSDDVFDNIQKAGKHYIKLNVELWKCEYQNGVENETMRSVENDNINPETTIAYDETINFDSDLDKLRDKIHHLISFELSQIKRDGMAIDNFYDAWNKFLSLTNIKVEKYTSPYERLFVYLYRYLFGKTDIYDRYFLYTEIRFCLEPYLKRIVGEIDDFEADKTIKDGLGKMIEKYQARGVLPARNVECKLTRFISNTINIRNKKGHNEELTPSDEYMISRIKGALVLYLYVADKQCSA